MSFEKHGGRCNSVVRYWLPTYLHVFLCFSFSRLDRVMIRHDFREAVADCSKALAGYFLNAYTFLPALTLAYAYTYAQDNPTRQVSFFIITFDAKYLPIALLFLTMIMEDVNAAMAQATGLIAAHLYDFLTRIWPTFGGGTNYITTPSTVKRWFGGGPGSLQARSYGFAQEARAPAAAPATGRTTGASTGQQWGPGRRLGE